MTVRIKPWCKNGKSGYEVDIRLVWSDGTKYRKRVKSPVTGQQASLRWGQRREAELLRAGKDSATKSADDLTDEVDLPDSVVPTLASFSDRWLKDHVIANGQKPSGYDAKVSVLRIHLLPHLGDRRLDSIKTSDIQRLKAIYREGVKDAAGEWIAAPTDKPKTINNRLSVLSKLLRCACDWDVIPSMPCTVKLVKVSETEALFYEGDVLDRLVTAAAKVSTGALCMVLLGADAGLRRGEIVGLEWTDIDLKRRQICIQRHVYKGKAGTTKGNRSRYVPLTERLAAALQAHRHLRGARVLFFQEVATKVWRPITPKLIKMWMLQVERDAGVPQTGRIHVMRHTFCSRLAMAGAPALTIQKLAGHTSLTTTMRYMHLARGATEAAIGLLDRRQDVVDGAG